MTEYIMIILGAFEGTDQQSEYRNKTIGIT